MTNAGGHMVILAGAGLAAAFLSAYMLSARQTEPVQEAVVVTLPQRSQPPAPQPASRPQPERPQPAVGPGPMSDPAALTRTLQRELRRVGCYDGEVSGVWSPASRAAMKAFTDRVNASLPVDRPDPILLALLQARQGRACGEACPPGEAQNADGRCLPIAIISKTQGKPTPAADAEPKVEPSRAAPVPIPVPVPIPARKPPVPPAAAVEPAPPPHVAVAPPQPAPAPPPPIPRAQPADEPGPQSTHPRGRPRDAGPVPAVRVYGRTIRRFVRRAPSKPAAVARSLLRSLERAAQGPW